MYGTFLRQRQLNNAQINVEEGGNIEDINIDEISIYSYDDEKLSMSHLDGLSNLEENV